MKACLSNLWPMPDALKYKLLSRCCTAAAHDHGLGRAGLSGGGLSSRHRRHSADSVPDRRLLCCRHRDHASEAGFPGRGQGHPHVCTPCGEPLLTQPTLTETLAQPARIVDFMLLWAPLCFGGGLVNVFVSALHGGPGAGGQIAIRTRPEVLVCLQKFAPPPLPQCTPLLVHQQYALPPGARCLKRHKHYLADVGGYWLSQSLSAGPPWWQQ